MVAPSTSRIGTKPEPVRRPCSAISNTRRSASSTSSVAVRPSLSYALAATSPLTRISCRSSERSRTMSA